MPPVASGPAEPPLPPPYPIPGEAGLAGPTGIPGTLPGAPNANDAVVPFPPKPKSESPPAPLWANLIVMVGVGVAGMAAVVFVETDPS